MKTLTLLILLLSHSGLRAATFLDPTSGLTFEYDEKLWETAAEGAKQVGEGADVDRAMSQKTLVSLQRRLADDKYHSRLSVVLDSLDTALRGQKDLSFEKYQKYGVDFLKSQRFTIQSEEKRTLHNGLNAFETVAYQRDFGLTFQQVMVPKDRQVFLITLSVRTKQFPSYSVEMDKILASLRVGTTVSLMQSR